MTQQQLPSPDLSESHREHGAAGDEVKRTGNVV